MSPDRLRVGRVAGAVGLAGAVKVNPLTDFPDRFRAGSQLRVGDRTLSVEWSRPGGEKLVVKFAEVSSRQAAEGLAGAYLEVPFEAAHELPDGAYYHFQLVGLRVVTEAGKDLGRVDDVLINPVHDVWVVRGETETLVPATRAAVSRVDLEVGEIVVADWVEETVEETVEASDRPEPTEGARHAV